MFFTPLLSFRLSCWGWWRNVPNNKPIWKFITSIERDVFGMHGRSTVLGRLRINFFDLHHPETLFQRQIMKSWRRHYEDNWHDEMWSISISSAPGNQPNEKLFGCVFYLVMRIEMFSIKWGCYVIGFSRILWKSPQYSIQGYVRLWNPNSSGMRFRGTQKISTPHSKLIWLVEEIGNFGNT